MNQREKFFSSRREILHQAQSIAMESFGFQAEIKFWNKKICKLKKGIFMKSVKVLEKRSAALILIPAFYELSRKTFSCLLFGILMNTTPARAVNFNVEAFHGERKPFSRFWA